MFRGFATLIEKIDYRLKLTKNFDHELDCKAFSSCSKNDSQRVFTRDRKLTVRNLIFILLGFKSSTQRKLNRFYSAISDSDFNIREVTKGALTQARAKLNPWAFKRMNQVAVESFYNVSPQPSPYSVGKNLAFTLPKKADERLATNYQGVRII